MERRGRLAPCGSRRPNGVREALRLHQATYLSAMRPGLSAAQANRPSAATDEDDPGASWVSVFRPHRSRR